MSVKYSFTGLFLGLRTPNTKASHERVPLRSFQTIQDLNFIIMHSLLIPVLDIILQRVSAWYSRCKLYPTSWSLRGVGRREAGGTRTHFQCRRWRILRAFGSRQSTRKSSGHRRCTCRVWRKARWGGDRSPERGGRGSRLLKESSYSDNVLSWNFESYRLWYKWVYFLVAFFIIIISLNSNGVICHCHLHFN